MKEILAEKMKHLTKPKAVCVPEPELCGQWHDNYCFITSVHVKDK